MLAVVSERGKREVEEIRSKKLELGGSISPLKSGDRN